MLCTCDENNCTKMTSATLSFTKLVSMLRHKSIWTYFWRAATHETHSSIQPPIKIIFTKQCYNHHDHFHHMVLENLCTDLEEYMKATSAMAPLLPLQHSIYLHPLISILFYHVIFTPCFCSCTNQGEKIIPILNTFHEWMTTLSPTSDSCNREYKFSNFQGRQDRRMGKYLQQKQICVRYVALICRQRECNITAHATVWQEVYCLRNMSQI
jgi:hypothetical protein